MGGHTHNYIVVRTVTKTDKKGKTTTFTFMECINPGCPSPNKVTTS